MTDSRDEAFSDAYPALFRRAYQASFTLCGDRELAKELAQEAMIRAYARWAHLDARREGWVVTTAVRLTIDQWRRAGRRQSPHRAQDAESFDSATAQRLDLLQLLAALPRRQREVAVLRYLEDRPEREVAELLGCSVGSVKRHASRAVAALRTALEPTAPITEAS